MISTYRNTGLFVGLAFIILLSSCQKFLEEKPDKKMIVPQSLEELQALLDNYGKINFSGAASGEASADDYYLTEADFSSLSQEIHRRTYTWQKDFLFDNFPNDWSKLYDVVYYANTVLEALKEIDQPTATEDIRNNIEGQARFLRAHAFLQALAIWTVAYDHSTAHTDMGIPLRRTADFNELSRRATLKESYEQVTEDLTIAASLLPDAPAHPLRAAKPAAFALLARTRLWMQDYTGAEKFADSCLRLNNTLLDFNSSEINRTASFPFSPFHKETLFYSEANIPQNLNNSRAKIDSNLWRSYADNDIRKTAFFRNNNNGTFGFKGGYTGSLNIFTGIATDEVYLTRAETRARRNNITGAMEDLNTLLKKRWIAGSFTSVSAVTAEEAFNLILLERRKELLMRGLRWMDIKRLNKQGSQLALRRILGPQTFQLAPNDLRFALPIPEAVIREAGIPQNPR